MTIESQAFDRWGEPNRRLSTRSELRFGRQGSVAVQVAGEKAGAWFDFEEGEGGHLDDAVEVQEPAPNAPRLIVAKYDYVSLDGEVVYRQRRYMPKDFRPDRPDGNGGWVEGQGCLDGIERVPYRLLDVVDASDVIIVEGEKDCDALAELGFVASFNGPAKWSEVAHYFAGKRVYVVPDNDRAGLRKATDCLNALDGVATDVIWCPICEDMGDKADISNWLARNDSDRLMALLQSYDQVRPVRASGFRRADMASVPGRSWLYGKHLIRGYVSATVSPGGVGKTTLELIEAVALSTGRDLLGKPVRERVRVWHYNLEDPRDELLRRVWAICEHFKIDPAELEGWLYLDSGRDCKMIVAEPKKSIVVATAAVDQVIAEMQQNKISVLQVDPFVKSHWAEENDNKQIDAVLDVFGDIAKQCNAAVDLVHHTRKPPSGFVATAGDINTARGAGALAGAVRSARTVTPMSEKEATSFDIDPARRGWYVRVDDAKGNMSAPATEANWYERESVELSNGDYVGVMAPWSPPDPFEGLGVERAKFALNMIEQGLDDGQRFTATARAGTSRWAGNVLLDLDLGEGAAKSVLRAWLKSGALFTDLYKNPVRRRDEKGLFVDFSKMPGGEI